MHDNPKTINRSGAYIQNYVVDATVGTCLSQFNGNLLNGRCFITGEMSPSGTWFDARNMCLSQGDLASFDHIDLSSLRNISWLNSTQTYWIGLSRNKWTVGGINGQLIDCMTLGAQLVQVITVNLVRSFCIFLNTPTIIISRMLAMVNDADVL